MAGGQRGQGGRERGADLRYNMEITLEDAFGGKAAEIRIPTSVTCETCSGSVQSRQQAEALPALRRRRPHPSRAGLLHAGAHLSGLSWPRPGHRRSVRLLFGLRPGDTRAHAVGQHSPGVEDGTRIRLAGEGEAGMRGGPPGDLYIFLSLAAHQFFQRDGAICIAVCPFPWWRRRSAGSSRCRPSKKVRLRLKVPSGTQSAAVPHCRQGMPVLRARQDRRYVCSGGRGNAAKPH